MGDKMKKIYAMSPKKYRKRITEEVTKFYKKAPISYVDNINTEAKEISTKFGISNKIRTIAERQAF